MWNGKLKKTVVQVSTGCEFANNGRRMSAHLHVRTSARLGRKGHKGTVKTDAALPCRAGLCHRATKTKRYFSCTPFLFPHSPCHVNTFFQTCAEQNAVWTCWQTWTRAGQGVLSLQDNRLVSLFFFFCALTLLSAAQGKHEWTAMKSTGSCFSQKKALRHPLRLLQKPQAVNGKARGKLTHNGNGGPNGLCPGLPDSDRLRRAGSCQACRPDRDTPIP